MTDLFLLQPGRLRLPDRRGGATQGRAERGEPRCAHGTGGGDRRPLPIATFGRLPASSVYRSGQRAGLCGRAPGGVSPVYQRPHADLPRVEVSCDRDDLPSSQAGLLRPGQGEERRRRRHAESAVEIRGIREATSQDLDSQEERH